MAIEVEGPDGSVVEFPDGTSHDVIKGAMAKHFGSPTKAQPPVSNQQQTEELPFYTKAAKALAYGAAQTRSKDVDTLRKSGALGMDLDKVDRNTEWLKQQAGLQNYDPASAHFADSSKPWTERLGYLPRALLEGTPEMAQHIAASTVGGPLGMLASTAVAEGGSAVNRVREADKTDPNAELTFGQKARVGGNVTIQALLNEVGAKATLGATKPIKDVGMAGVKQAVGNVGRAAGIDAAVGGLGAASDKAIVEQQAPSVADVALPALAGASVGTAFRAPGAARDAAVSTRFRSLGQLDPQSRGQVADILQRYDGDFKATEKHVLDDLKVATKGMDEATRDTISKAKIQHEAGQRIDTQQIEAVSKVDPDAGRTLRNLDTLGVMRGLDNGGLSGSDFVQAVKPFAKGAKLIDFGSLGVLLAGGHIPYLGHVSPEIAATILGTQAGIYGGARGIDALTGASNPAKVITDRYAGTADPVQTIAEARAAAFAKDIAERQAKVGAAKADLDAAKAESVTTKLEGDIGSLATKRIKQLAKERKAESDALWKAASESVRALNKRDDLQAKEERRVDTGIRQQADIMRRSQAVEEARLAAEQRDADAAMRRQADIMRNSQRVEDQRVASEQNAADAAMRSQADMMRRSQAVEEGRLAGLQREADAAMRRQADLMRNSQSVEERRVANNQRASDQQMARQANLMRNSQAVEQQRQSQMLGDIGQQLRIMQASETASSSPAALPLAVAKLKAGFARDAEANAPAPEPTFNTDSMFWGPSSSIKGTPAEKAMMATRALERHNAKIAKQEQTATRQKQKQEKEATQAKAEKRVKDAEAKVSETTKDANENMYVFEHRGQKVRVPKEFVGSAKLYETSFREKVDRRMDVIDAAKSLTKSGNVKKMLDQLAKDWTDTTNNPELAYGHLERTVNKSGVPKNVADFLLDNWGSVEGTWATTRRDIENE